MKRKFLQIIIHQVMHSEQTHRLPMNTGISNYQMSTYTTPKYTPTTFTQTYQSSYEFSGESFFYAGSGVSKSIIK